MLHRTDPAPRVLGETNLLAVAIALSGLSTYAGDSLHARMDVVSTVSRRVKSVHFMHSAREVIETYIRAKDQNRPFLMERAFAENARLEVIVSSGTIAFPPVAEGLHAITDVLVRRFAQSYENVHTFCLAKPPQAPAVEFECDWLVGMSEKDSGRLRIGCGHYDWRFERGAASRVAQLKIAIQLMESLAPGGLGMVMNWLSQLPYPWCTRPWALRAAPLLPGLEGVRRFLESADSR